MIRSPPKTKLCNVIEFDMTDPMNQNIIVALQQRKVFSEVEISSYNTRALEFVDVVNIEISGNNTRIKPNTEEILVPETLKLYLINTISIQNDYDYSVVIIFVDQGGESYRLNSRKSRFGKENIS